MKKTALMLCLLCCSLPAFAQVAGSHNHVTVFVSDYQALTDPATANNAQSSNPSNQNPPAYTNNNAVYVGYSQFNGDNGFHGGFHDHEDRHESIPSVPEPDSALMLVAGLALIGYALSRRKK